MVQIKLESSIREIRGQCGGVYFKTGRPGQHMQSMPRHVRYNQMGFQSRFRDAYSAAGAFWGLILVASFAAAWAAYALVNLFIDRNGESKRITGYNWYIHYALTFPEAEALPFWKPPHAQGVRPDYYVVTLGRWQYRLLEKDWPDFVASDYYWDSGMVWNGEIVYRTDNGLWFIWWKDPNWIISPAAGHEPVNYTYVSDADKINDYYWNADKNIFAHVYIGTRR